MIAAITSHLVSQYWPYRLLPICLLDCVINIQFQGKNNSWGRAAPATVQSAAKKSRLCNNQILQDFMAKLRKPTDPPENPWDMHLILQKSGQSVMSMSLYHHHFIIFPHTRQPSPLGPTTSDCSQTGPIIQSGEWWQRRPKRSAPEIAENWKRFTFLMPFFDIFCFIRFNPARQKLSKPQSKIGFSQFYTECWKTLSAKKRLDLV